MKKKQFYLLVILITPLLHSNGFCQNDTITQVGVPRASASYYDILVGPSGNEVGYLFPLSGLGEGFAIEGRRGLPISFIFHKYTSSGDSESIKAFDIRQGRNNDITFWFTQNDKMNRFTTEKGGYFGFSTDGRGMEDDDVDLVIGSAGLVGIGISNPASKLHVHQGGITYTEPLTGHIGRFQLHKDAEDEGFWMGTATDTPIEIGCKLNTFLQLFPNEYAIIHKNQIPKNINPTNKSKYSLFVEGGILSENYALGPVSSWADYVFEKGYKLRDIQEVEDFIETNGHLPDIPSAETISKEGYSLHEMNVKLLQKIEELTLYVIGQGKEIDKLKNLLENYEIEQKK